MVEYVDADGGSYPDISKIPFIILRATGGKCKTVRQQALDAGIKVATFTEAMIEGTWEEQMERSKNTKYDDLGFFGVVLFGEWDKVTEITRKFSLWK